MTLFLVGCSSFVELDRVAEINEIEVELSPRGKEINRGRNLVLEGKQSLKIALLKIKFLVPGVDYHHNSVVVLDRDVFFNDRDELDMDSEQRNNLQRSLLPELFQIYSALEEMKMTLIVSCSKASDCSPRQLRDWIPSPISVVGISKKNKSKLRFYNPILILSSNRTILSDIQNYKPQHDSTYWSSRWIKLPQFSQVQLSYNEWSSLIPTVTKF